MQINRLSGSDSLRSGSTASPDPLPPDSGYPDALAGFCSAGRPATHRRDHRPHSPFWRGSDLSAVCRELLGLRHPRAQPIPAGFEPAGEPEVGHKSADFGFLIFVNLDQHGQF